MPWLASMWRKLRDMVVFRILGVEDTCHRIAWGAGLGMFVAWTPTIGFQLVTYFLLAALLRANKVSGVPIIFISNPLTAVPMYYFAWRIGALLLGEPLHPEKVSGALEVRLDSASSENEATATDGDVFSESLDATFWTLEYWLDKVDALLDMGAALWLGCVVVGLVSGILAYVAVYLGVKHFQRSAAGKKLALERQRRRSNWDASKPSAG